MGRILKLRGADGKWLEVPAIKGSEGATFTPNVSNEGVLSWENDKGLKNPDPISIKGPIGSEGATFTPHLSETGDLSWTNNKGLPNPDPVNIIGKVSTDPTLTVEGTPADAKATGDKIIDVELGSALRVKNLRTEFNKSLSDLDEAKQPKGNYLTSESDPTVPSWAKEETKPTYTANEVGALPKDGTAVDSSKLGGKAPEYYIQPHNLLDNSDFRNPVNQRGASSYKGSTYSFDRWFFYSGDATNSQVYKRDGNVGLKGGTSAASISQRFPKGYLDSSKIYTLAYYDNVNDKLTIKSNPVYFSRDDFDYMNIAVTTGAATFIQWAALYEGAYTADTLPSYVPKGYAAELAECQRYYQTIPALTHIPGVTNTSVSFGARYKIPTMRIAPTVSIASGQEVSIYTGEYSSTTVGYTMQYASNPNQITLNITLSAGSFVAYKPGMLTFPVDIALSADL